MKYKEYSLGGLMGGGDKVLIKRNLKILREIKDLNQSQIGEYLGISLQSYCNKENGKVSFTLEEARRISELFKLSIEDIFFNSIDLKMNTSDIA